MQANVTGRVRNTNLPKTQGLLPLYEAIINSIDAIEETGWDISDGRIIVRILRAPSLELETKTDSVQRTHDPIYGFEIQDNGIGFIEQNYLAFNEADTQVKANLGGKGVGRFLWLKAFDRAEVDSTFMKNGQIHRRTFEFTLASADGIRNHKMDAESKIDEGRTIVRLLGFQEEYEKRIPRSPKTISQRIVEHCLEYLVLGIMPSVIIHDEKLDEEINLHDLYKELVANTKLVPIDVKRNKFNITHFMLHAHPDLKHHISYCGNKRVVVTERIGNKIPNLPTTLSRLDSDDQVIYAGYISSTYLDEHVTQERTSFETLAEGSSLFPGELTWADIEKDVLLAIQEFLQPFTETVRKHKEERIREYVNNHAPEYRHIVKNHPEQLDAIHPDVSNENLDLQLHEINRNIEIKLKKNADEFLKEIELTEDEKSFEQEWEEKFARFWQEWNELGKANLAKYIIHRKKMLTFFEQALKRQSSGNYSREEAIHKTIFPLKSTSDNVTYDQHNLWLIDEKLSYHEYLASDIPLKKVANLESKSSSRPDLMIFFDNAFAVVDDESPYTSGIVIFEFKRPMKDDYDEKDNPIQQVLRYVEEIKEGKKIDKDGRPINISPLTPFFCYIISDLTKSLKDQAKYAGLRSTPDAGGYFGYNEGVGAYIEVMDFEKLVRDSKKRNRVLFNKLNLPDR